MKKPILFITVLLTFFFFAKSASAWKFAVLGDTRPGNDYDHSQNVYGITYKMPNSERVTVFNSGDLTEDGTTAQWANFKSIVAPLGVTWTIKNPPQYISAVGNHDTHDANWLTNWADNLPGQKSLTAYSDIPADTYGRYGSVKSNNAIFVWADYYNLPSGQENFLRNTLVRAKSDTQVVWKFVAFHSPPVSCGGANEDWIQGRTWHDSYFQPNGVDIIFLGDNHYYERTCPFKNGLEAASNAASVCDTGNRGSSINNTSGVIHIVAGGGGAETEGYEPTTQCSWLESDYRIAHLHHFMEIEINGNTLHAKVWDTDTGVGTNPQPPANTNFALIDEFTVQKAGGGDTTPPAAPTGVRVQ